MDVRREVDDLLASEHPSLRWKVRTGVLGEDAESRSVRRLREEIRASQQARGLLEGHAARRPSAYAKWYGAHWVLQSLADLGYPEGADELVPLRDQVLGTWLATRYLREYVDIGAPKDRYRAAVPVAGWPAHDGARHSRVVPCWRSSGWASTTDGLPGSRNGCCTGSGRTAGGTATVARRSRPRRCTKRSCRCGRSRHGRRSAATALHEGPPTSAAEVLLRRSVVFRRSDPARLVRTSWGELRYPAYWHHGLLSGLVALAGAGGIGDARCAPALDLLERKRLPGGGVAG